MKEKKVGKWVSLWCTVGYKWPVGYCIMDGIKFESNNMISLYICIRKTILSGDGLSV